MATPEPRSQQTPIPATLSASINFVPELTGRLHIGNFDSRGHIELDFDTDNALTYVLPKFCTVLSAGSKALCEVQTSTGTQGGFVYDMPTDHRNFEDRQAVRWDLTSSQRLIAYAREGTEEGRVTLEAYDVVSGASRHIGDFDSKQSSLAIPWVSNSGESMIGLRYGETSGGVDDSWYRMDAGTMVAEPLTIPANIAATDSVEWSPDDSLVALVGFYKDDEEAPVGVLQCNRVALIYDPVARGIRLEVKVPEGRCYTLIDLWPARDSIWSPDGSKLALLLDDQDICIVDVAAGGSECMAITDHRADDFRVGGLTWSPDSAYVAYSKWWDGWSPGSSQDPPAEDGEIRVYSLEGKMNYLIADLDELLSPEIGNQLVWGQ